MYVEEIINLPTKHRRTGQLFGFGALIEFLLVNTDFLSFQHWVPVGQRWVLIGPMMPNWVSSDPQFIFEFQLVDNARIEGILNPKCLH